MYSQVTERHAFLTIKDADKSDGGVYRLDLENNLGSDSGNLTFTVNGKLQAVSKPINFLAAIYHAL